MLNKTTNDKYICFDIFWSRMNLSFVALFDIVFLEFQKYIFIIRIFIRSRAS